MEYPNYCPDNLSRTKKETTYKIYYVHTYLTTDTRNGSFSLWLHSAAFFKHIDQWLNYTFFMGSLYFIAFIFTVKLGPNYIDLVPARSIILIMIYYCARFPGSICHLPFLVDTYSIPLVILVGLLSPKLRRHLTQRIEGLYDLQHHLEVR